MAAGQISVLAVAETLVSVAVYFWLAQHFERQWWWLLTALAAPILLLRSDESKELGLRWFTKYFDPNPNQRPLTRTEKGFMTVPAVMLAVTIIYWLTSTWLVEYQGWPLFWRSLLTGAIAPLVGIAVGIAIAIERAVAVAGAVVRAIERAGEVALALAVAIAIAIAIAMGVWTRSLLIRITASLRYCRSGLANLPNNWQQLLWIVDVKHEPELIPGLNQTTDDLSLNRLLSDDQKFATYPVAVVLFLPALLWRWSLKSTLWMWWPVALLLRRPLANLSPELVRDHAAVRVCSAGQAIVYCAGLMALWLLVNRWPDLQQWLAVLPEPWSKLGGEMLTKQAPPPIGIRYGLLCLASGLGLMTAWQSKRLKAMHKPVLEDDSKFTVLNADRQNLFAARARHLEHWHTATVVSLIALGYAVVLWKGQQLYPQEIAHYLHPWLLQHL
ncbi:hypothetical protein [Methylomonas albis]|nr:hypothetical protein [Methylomonas albis]